VSPGKPPAKRATLRPATIAGIGFLFVVAGLVALGIKTGTCENKLSGWLSSASPASARRHLLDDRARYTMGVRVLQLLNFAHSEIFMVGSFAGLYSLSGLFGSTRRVTPTGWAGWSSSFSCRGHSAGGARLGCDRGGDGTGRVPATPARGASRLSYLITAIGVSLFLSNLFQLLDGQKHLGLPFAWPRVAGPAPVTYPPVMGDQKHAFSLLGVSVDNQTILVFGVAILIAGRAGLVRRRTRAGRGIRAVAEDPETAGLMGVNIDGIVVLTFFVGGLMAGAAGSCTGCSFTQAQFNMGFIPGIKASPRRCWGHRQRAWGDAGRPAAGPRRRTSEWPASATQWQVGHLLRGPGAGADVPSHGTVGEQVGE